MLPPLCALSENLFHILDDTIFLQTLDGIIEISLKDKIETTNSENDENDYLNIIKHSSYFDADKFKNHIKNYNTKTVLMC